MNTFKTNLFIIAMIFSLASFSSKASHIMGGEITYSWVTGNDYIVKLVLYRDCSGIPVTNPANIGVVSTSCQDSFIVVLPEVSFDKLTPSCSGNTTTCYGGSAFGYERHTFMDTVSLPFACADWKFVFAECCRNGAITNLVSGGAYGAYFYATLDNLNFPFNNSPSFTADPIVFLASGVSAILNNGAFDSDGDSLVVSLAPALDGINGYTSPSLTAPILYTAPFTFNDPVTSIPPLTIDPSTGTINVTPQNVEVDVVVYKVDEYRNGSLIGTTTRDLQIYVEIGTNQLPTLTGINGTANFVINTCYTDTLQFNISSNDLDPTDSLTISWHAFTGSNSTGSNYSFNTAGTFHDSATFTFIPDLSKVSANPYYLYVSVKDDACPYYGLQTYCYVIYVNSCSQDVWPGDANSDLAVNLYDLLPIGLAYNNTGPVRANASLSWTPQPATDWSGAFVSGVNHKHADCNGDGIVDYADTAGISANYGLAHPPKLTPGNPGVATTADMYIIASPDTVSASNLVNIKICLGTSLVPVDSIYGIGFRINFNPSAVNPTSGALNYSGSWMGTQGTDLLTFDRSYTSLGYADVAMVRNTHSNISGDSLLCVFSIVIVDNIAGKASLAFDISDVYAITYSEAQLSFNLLSDSIVINTTTSGIHENNGLDNKIKIFPIPAKNNLTVVTGGEFVKQISLTDLAGRKIMQLNEPVGNKINIKLDGFSEGVYFISVKTTHGTVNKRITVSKD